MKQKFEVVIIDGDIIGSSIAYHLAKEQVDVAVLEAVQIGAQTASAVAGMLGAHSESTDKAPATGLLIRNLVLEQSMDYSWIDVFRLDRRQPTFL